MPALLPRRTYIRFRSLAPVEQAYIAIKYIALVRFKRVPILPPKMS